MPCKPEIAATFVPLPLPKTPLKQKIDGNNQKQSATEVRAQVTVLQMFLFF
jgi:hypothetical protein